MSTETPWWLASPERFAEFVAAWEQHTLPKAEWTHAGHVGVGAAYAVRHRVKAFGAMAHGIRTYNVAVGGQNTDESGYHETLTRLWVEVLAFTAAGHTDEFAAACDAVARYGQDRALHTRYYSFDVVRSTQARREWMAPDLEDLPTERAPGAEPPGRGQAAKA